MKPTLEDYDDQVAIKCPHCGDAYLHHDEVRVFERAEGSVTKMCVTVRGMDAETVGDQPQEPRFPTVRVDDCMTGNPSGRRQGVEVGMWCENCRMRSQFRIVQHKGMTFLSIERTQYEMKAVEAAGGSRPS